MASTSTEKNLSSQDNHREKYTDSKRSSNSRKHEHEESRSDSSSHSRRKSPTRTRRNSSPERRDHSGHFQDRNTYATKERRTVYRSEDRDHDRYKSKNESSHAERNKSKHESALDDRQKSKNENAHDDRHVKYPEERDNHFSKSNDERPGYSNRYGDHKSSDVSYGRLTEKTDYQKPNDERLSNRERFSDLGSPGGRYVRSSDKITDRYEESFSDHHKQSNHNSLGKGPNDLQERVRDHHKAHAERQISYRNSTVSGDEEFIASLLQKIDFLSNQVEYLTQENEKLKLSVKNGNDSSAAEVSILFSNKRFEEKFLPILKELATDLITGRCTIEALTTFLTDTSVSQQHSDSWNPEGELFSLDISCEEPKESSSVPRYDSSFSEMLQTPDKQAEEEALKNKKTTKRFAKVCFNCDGDHFIGECPQPLNQRRIAQARKRQRSTFAPPSNKRYHVHGNQEAEFKPGTISDELREALGLQKQQIPLYIYRMRILDYPPGWLADAAVERSGITLYGSDGMALSDTKTGDGKNEDNVQYDPAKLIDYPGFNTPLPSDFVDESSALGLPQMQEFQLRQYIEQALPKPEPVSRKRKLVLPEPKNNKINRHEESMEVDDDLAPSVLEFNPPLPEDSLPPPPPDDCPDSPSTEYEEVSNDKIPVQLDSDSQSGKNTPISDLRQYKSKIEPFKLEGSFSPSSGSASPSLKELEEIKKRLVIELEITGEVPSPCPPLLDDSVSKDGDSESLKANPSTPLSDHLKTLENVNDLSNFSDSSFSSKASGSAEITSGLPRTESVGSKLVSLGTPSISRHSSYSKLPSYDNFSKDVTDHLNFENLPNSTGTYERMKKVIKKVKAKINSIIQ